MLTPCGACRRHVEDRESACPFCGATLEPTPRLRNLARAAVFVGAALATTACGGKKGGDTTPPPPPPTADAGTTAEPTPVDAAQPQPDIKERDIPRPPYGAPPARRRIV